MNSKDLKPEYAELLLQQHIIKLQYFVMNASGKFNADTVSLIMASIRNTYNELSKVHISMVAAEAKANVAKQDV